MHRIAAYLSLLPPLEDDQSTTYSSSFLLEILIALHERRPSQLEALNDMPLYPTENILWDQSVVPNEYFDGEGIFVCLSVCLFIVCLFVVCLFIVCLFVYYLFVYYLFVCKVVLHFLNSTYNF